MADTTVATTPAPMNVFTRFFGIITSPAATFQNVAAHPKWLGMALLISLVIGIFASLPLTTPEGKQAYVDQSVRAIEQFGFQVNDEMYAGIQKQADTAVYTTGIYMLFAIPLGCAIVSGILFAVFNAALGGSARFKQLFAVVVHSGVISALGGVFTGLVNYYRGTMSNSVANLAALLPMVPEDSFFGRFLGMVDFFTIWAIIVLSIGLAVLYRRKTQPIATTFLVIYAVIVLGIAAALSR